MKRFSKLVESKNLQKNFKVSAEVELVFKADNEGEAGYLGDSELGSLENQVNFNILDISEITEEEFKKSKGIFDENLNENFYKESDSNLINLWNQKFGSKKPTMTEKMEFYHQMRKNGYDGSSILNTLKDKISFYTR